VNPLVNFRRSDSILNMKRVKSSWSTFLCIATFVSSMCLFFQARAEYVTLTARVTDNTVFPSTSITLASNEVAQVLHTKLESTNGSDSGTEYMFLTVTIGGQTFTY